MKLHEIIELKWLNNSLILEMAVSRANARKYVSSVGGPVVDQFLKLTYLNSPNNYRHWLEDGINNYLKNVQKLTLKGTNKGIPAKFVYQWLFDDILTLDVRTIEISFNVLTKGKYKGVPLKKELNATEVVLDLQHIFNPSVGRILNDIESGKFVSFLNYYQFE